MRGLRRVMSCAPALVCRRPCAPERRAVLDELGCHCREQHRLIVAVTLAALDPPQAGFLDRPARVAAGEQSGCDMAERWLMTDYFYI